MDLPLVKGYVEGIDFGGGDGLGTCCPYPTAVSASSLKNILNIFR